MVQELSLSSPTFMSTKRPKIDPLGVSPRVVPFILQAVSSTSRSTLLPEEQHPCYSFSHQQQSQQTL